MLIVSGFFYGGVEAMPAAAVPFMIAVILVPLVIIGGILLALRERLKEIGSGEEDAAAKY